MNFYPFHIGDYLSHTAHLSDAEDLAYRRMLDLYYQTEKPFEDPSWVARRVRTTVEIVEVLLNEFFYLDVVDGTWHHDRCDAEIIKYHAKAESARNANRMRWASDRDQKSDASQIPTRNQEPVTKNQEPRTKSQEPKARKPKEADPSLEGRREIWNSYCNAYADRYGVAPLQNGKANSLIKRFSELVPMDEAPAIAAHYVGHNGQFYVAKMHPLELLVADAGKLRTEWATGIAMTSTRARQADRTSSMLSIVDEIRRERGEA